MKILDWVLKKRVFTRLELFLNFILSSFLGSYLGFIPVFLGIVFAVLIACLIEIYWDYSYDCYCPICNGCGEIYCDGVDTFLEKHVRGITTCTEEDSFIDQIEELWEDYKKE